MKNEVRIAGRNVSCRTAADWLVRSYPHATIRWYDLAGRSRKDGVTLDDLGRMTVFAARLDYKGAVSLLEKGAYAPWSPMKRTARLDALPDSTEIEFLADAQTRAALSLFWYFAPGNSRWAWTSKLLHLKWPSFYPIADSMFRRVYAETAQQILGTVLISVGRERQRKQPPISAYWLAFRRDLIANARALDVVRSGLPAAAARAKRFEPQSVEKADALAKMTHLRLLDMLVWGASSPGE